MPFSQSSIHQIDHYLAYDVLPEIKRLLIDNDKILGACNNIVYYILNPALKNRSKWVCLYS